MSIPINMVPVIDYEEILCEMDKDSIQEFFFYRNSDNHDGYFWFNTDEDAIPYLEEQIDDEHFYAEKYNNGEVDMDFINAVRNDIALVEKLCAMGYDDGVLIYVWY